MWLVQPEGPSLLGPGACSEVGQHRLSHPILRLLPLGSFCALGVVCREWESVVSSGWLPMAGPRVKAMTLPLTKASCAACIWRQGAGSGGRLEIKGSSQTRQV